jgi:hypothetical protein
MPCARPRKCGTAPPAHRRSAAAVVAEHFPAFFETRRPQKSALQRLRGAERRDPIPVFTPHEIEIR